MYSRKLNRNVRKRNLIQTGVEGLGLCWGWRRGTDMEMSYTEPSQSNPPSPQPPAPDTYNSSKNRTLTACCNTHKSAGEFIFLSKHWLLFRCHDSGFQPCNDAFYLTQKPRDCFVTSLQSLVQSNHCYPLSLTSLILSPCSGWAGRGRG